jgi:hypothetical protein
MTFITTIPGRHASLAGNDAVDGDSGFNDLFGPGKVTPDLAEKSSGISDGFPSPHSPAAGSKRKASTRRGSLQ